MLMFVTQIHFLSHLEFNHVNLPVYLFILVLLDTYIALNIFAMTYSFAMNIFDAYLQTDK